MESKIILASEENGVEKSKMRWTRKINEMKIDKGRLQ
jgi:hypothetical protein